MPEWFSSHDAVDYQLALYLAAQGVVRDTNVDQTTSGVLPAVYVGELYDEPDYAIALTVVGEVRDDDANPQVDVLLAMRSGPEDRQQLYDLSEKVFQALHDRTRLELTANQGIALCRRTLKGPVVQDQNRRWLRVDTYRLRMLVPNP
jgi:hypothetical protein